MGDHMKTAAELMELCAVRQDWKHMMLWNWAYPYEKQMREWVNAWPPIPDDDDRKLYVFKYRQVYDAIYSLPDNPDAWICCAVRDRMTEECKLMNRILNQYGSTLADRA